MFSIVSRPLGAVDWSLICDSDIIVNIHSVSCYLGTCLFNTFESELKAA